MKNLQSGTTLTTLANGAELVAAIAADLLGDALPDTVNGSVLSKEALYSLAQTAFQATINSSLGAIQNVNA